MKLKRSSIERKTQVQNDWELSSINVDLFPTEIVDTATRALGETVMPDYFVDIYKFAIDAQNQQMQIKTTQLNGVLLTHKKIEKWLRGMGIQDACDLNNPHVLKIFLTEHIRSMENSVAVFKLIAASLGGN